MKKLIYNIALMGSVLYTSLAQGQVVLEALEGQNPPALTLPSGVSIEKGKHIIVSTLDNNYFPFSAPTQSASWDRNVNPDATEESKILDFQGTIPAEGVLVGIPITVISVGSTPIIPAYSQTISIPAWKTEDGISRDLTLEWEQQTYDANTKYIPAKIKPSGLLNVKKLDLNAGLGNDYQGVEVGTFTYAYNYTDNTTTGISSFEVRALAGIPDRNITMRGVRSVYFPVEINNKVWLNNNLGAAYSVVDHQYFNPIKQAETGNDGYALGDIYQWQRPADGHQLNLKSLSNPKIEGIFMDHFYFGSHRVTYELSESWEPNDYKFILTQTPLGSWNKNYNDGNYNLWKSNGKNNPCPYGFHVPTMEEWEQSSKNLSVLKLPDSGALTGMFDSPDTQAGHTGYYWSSSIVPYNTFNKNERTSEALYAHTKYGYDEIQIESLPHMVGMPIRCIQD